MSNFPVRNIKFNRKNEKKLGLPGIVSQWYYKHGLFLSSYPTCASSIAIIVIVFSCYPLLNIPLPGTIPTKIILPYDEIKNNHRYDILNDHHSHNNNNNININDDKIMTDNKINHENDNDNVNKNDIRNFSIVKNIFNINNMTFDTPFPWTQSNPFVYIQQIIIRSSVIPWTNDLNLMDAFRSPLYEIFKLLEIVRNHESPEKKINVDHICLHVENVKRPKHEQILPEYNCLILSPANLWGQDIHNFTKDSNILNTIFQYHNLQKSKVSIAEMLFGLPMQDTGIKRYPLRSRSRVIQYAITIMLIKYDQEYIDSLKQKLTSLYPLHQQKIDKKPDNNNNNNQNKLSKPASIMYIYYPGEFKLIEFLPICTAFIILFIYVYFSVRKIDIIKSRFILALCAVITVLGSLMMSLGLCFFFGLTISLQSKGIFPYLVILVGLENCLVITKSVVSTDDTFDVKIRVAQGLSKEGWHISKTLLTEITILTVGLATFVPVIQEFCVFAIVGLISDFFLQMLLFSTILAMDIKRIEYTVEAKNLPKIMCYVTNDLTKRQQYKLNRKLSPSTINQFGNNINNSTIGSNNSSSSSGVISGGFHRSQSHPKLPFLDYNTMTPLHHHHHHHQSGTSTSTKQNLLNDKKIPKRLRLVNFWARTRFFQRAFMIWMIVWISSIVYNSGFLENFFVMDLNNNTSDGMIINNKHNNEYDSNLINIDNNNNNGNDDNNLNNKHKIKLKNDKHNNNDNNDHQNNNDNLENENSENKNYEIQNDDINNEKKQIHTDENEKNTDNINNNFKNLTIINDENELYDKLKHPNYEINYFLSNFHWSSILKQYNISLSGKYVIILPAIKLSLAIKSEIALLLRNPNEKYIKNNFQWKTLAAALDPLDFNDNINHKSPIISSGGTPLYPKSPMEICLATILCAISIFVLTYTMIVFYRCICTKNYAEWRSSWNDNEISSNTEEILEGIPAQIKGHKHKIECLVSDGIYVVSSCLKGQIKVWDSKNCDLITKIDRSNINLLNMDYELVQQQQWQIKQKQENQYEEQKQLLFNSSNINDLSDIASTTPSLSSSFSSSINNSRLLSRNDNISPIWCLDYLDNLIAVGCANGQMEFWETPTGVLKCTSQAELKPAQGITHIHLNGDRVIVARLCGKIEFYKLETYYRGRQIDWGFTSAYRRTHVRTGSTGSINSATGSSGGGGGVGSGILNDRYKTTKEEMICTLEEVRNAHQQPIVCMEIVESIVFTGSLDHTLRVFKLDDSTFDYSLRGHCGPITCLFVDHWQPGTGGSGSQDGLLCVWDLNTGACMYNIQAHDGSITSLACAPSYVISLGTDERVCVWERFQGNLLTTINVTNSYSSLLMLTPSLLVTSKMGSLVVWDVRTGEPAREVKLDCANSQLCPKLMLLAGSSVICDYGNQLRIVRFPMVADKCN